MAKYILFCFLRIAYVFAQLQSFIPLGQNDITYSVNIPPHTASSGSGPIFFQMKSTQQVQWFAWGQGSQMQGANIFVVYASSGGNNITISPRLGAKHVEPLFNPKAHVSVLDGSSINNGIITANIRCDSCITWLGGHEDPASSSSPWVWAVKYGNPLDSDSVSATIIMHDAFGIAALNLQKAIGGTSENPFTTSAGAPSSGQAIESVHAFFQLFTLALAISGFGIGISMTKDLDLIQSYHPIIGMVVIPSLVLFQPAMGLFQHLYFRKTGKKSIFTYTHRWFGRAMITLGIINAGLGFRLTGIGLSIAPTGAIIAYSVVAGIVGLVYILAVIFLFFRKHRRPSS
ncbi:hypothetical protein BDV29DRAFT_200691 [Aspergillus leporis]|uniref:Cellobiose dehydrogenase cytochrome domain-containing protein n=1 Tax=Aspergillus leporis TaxID=41062 RepID=A0A5N5X4X8_9EURO|nr:hypothetical protein BDV29DRAFT_200691 [Aspergillus leporis]